MKKWTRERVGVAERKGEKEDKVKKRKNNFGLHDN